MRGEPFLESIAGRDYADTESLPDHQLEHALEQQRDDTSTADTVLARATVPGLAIELVGLEGSQAPGWDEATRYLDSLTSRNSRTICSSNAASIPAAIRGERGWTRPSGAFATISTASAPTSERGHDQTEEWDFHGDKIFAAQGSFDDDANPDSGYGWMCRLVDAGDLQAAGFYRVRKPLLL
jgi:hypothetical protein